MPLACFIAISVNKRKYLTRLLFNSEISERSRYSNVLVTFSDLSAVKYKWVKNYFFNLARIRAMELQKPMLVSSNNGVSGIITKKGRAVLERHAGEGFLPGSIMLAETGTPFLYFGNKLILMIIIPLLMFSMGWLLFRGGKS